MWTDFDLFVVHVLVTLSVKNRIEKKVRRQMCPYCLYSDMLLLVKIYENNTKTKIAISARGHGKWQALSLFVPTTLIN